MAPPPSGATLGQPFDPFATQPNSAGIPPSVFNTPGAAPFNAGPGFAPPPGQPLQGGQYPGYPAQPNVVFPGGLQGQPFSSANVVRLLDDFRFRYTWIEGSGGREVDINDVDVGITLNWPNFLHSSQPLRISPGFSFHFWDGPSPPFSPPGPGLADLPSRAYSAFINTAWTTNTFQRVGAEIDFTAGVYSDFQTVTSKSLRFQGTGLGWIRLTEFLTIKFGATYLDRNDIKLLPAGGFFWYPNEDIRLDIYFPRPKLARRLWTLGNTDVWGYLAAEYGGGSWTVERTFQAMANGDLISDQVDINDIRVIGGFEWLSGLAAVTGFVEVGWVTDRELVWRATAPGSQPLKDSFMLRGGLSF